MSYILDALKKAERERGIAKVPTLETIHETPGKSRKGLWIASAAVLSLLVITAGVLLFTGNGRGGDISAASNTAVQPAHLPENSSQPTENTAASEPIRQSKKDFDSSAPAGSFTTVETDQPADSRAARLKIPASSTGTGKGENYTAPANPAKRNAVSGPGEIDSLATPPVPPSTDTEISGGAATLQEAIEGMKVSIHLYSSNPSKRTIFIDGRKYAEGDYVKGLYLVEAITPEGAILSYEGARATLKASM